MRCKKIEISTLRFVIFFGWFVVECGAHLYGRFVVQEQVHMPRQQYPQDDQQNSDEDEASNLVRRKQQLEMENMREEGETNKGRGEDAGAVLFMGPHLALTSFFMDVEMMAAQRK